MGRYFLGRTSTNYLDKTTIRNWRAITTYKKQEPYTHWCNTTGKRTLTSKVVPSTICFYMEFYDYIFIN